MWWVAERCVAYKEVLHCVTQNIYCIFWPKLNRTKGTNTSQRCQKWPAFYQRVRLWTQTDRSFCSTYFAIVRVNHARYALGCNLYVVGIDFDWMDAWRLVEQEPFARIQCIHAGSTLSNSQRWAKEVQSPLPKSMPFGLLSVGNRFAIGTSSKINVIPGDSAVQCIKSHVHMG